MKYIKYFVFGALLLLISGAASTVNAEGDYDPGQ